MSDSFMTALAHARALAPQPREERLLPPRHIATIVTYLTMECPAAPPSSPPSLPDGFRLCDGHAHPLADHRALFRLIGEDWLWTSRLLMSDEKLAGLLDDPAIERWIIMENEVPSGLLEIDYRNPAEVELAFLGLAPSLTGKGLGSALIRLAIHKAFARPQTETFFVHTCTFDHPAALAFYQRHGFRPAFTHIETIEDPRLTGMLARDAAPHIPLGIDWRD